jgi:NAD dependent epimerase/dehydratase
MLAGAAERMFPLLDPGLGSAHLMSRLSGTKVSVTGAGGFIGSHLVEALVSRGAAVRAMVRYNSRADRGALEWISPDVLSDVEVVVGDVRDVESAAQAVEGCETVFNLAALIAIPYSYVNPRDYFETNVLGTLNLLQAARSGSLSRFVHTSTSEVYGNTTEFPITAGHPVTAASPYAASKIGADQLALSFYRTYDVPVTLLRPFNTYGPRQSTRAVIPTILAQALNGNTIRIGSLEPRRDLTFVTDTVSGFIAAAEAESVVGETLQLGTGDDVSVGELIQAVQSLVERDLEVVQEDRRVRPEKSEVSRLVSDPSRMTEATGWRAEVALEEGLEKTMRWLADRPPIQPAEKYAI